MSSLYLVVESPVHGKDVLLAFVADSCNSKTGNMIQVYILDPTIHPVDAVREGRDDVICGHCPQRHSLGGGCYVVVGHGPSSTYRGWINSGRRVDSVEDVVDLCSRRHVRLGAYGDISHIPAWLAGDIIASAKGHTAYTHQWRNPVVADTWRGRAMASLDSPAQIKTAESAGWNWFLATSDDVYKNLTCANELDDRTQCRDCMKCDGTQGNVVITPHGMRKKKFER